MVKNLEKYSNHYKSELLENILPFWQKFSKDETHGGYFTCLTKDGEVFDTDKFIWLQGRGVWMFSMLYNNLEARQEWLDYAQHGADFLQKYGQAPDGTWYFSLTREGKPLIQPYNIFSDCFATQAFGQLYKATQKAEYAELARNTFYSILERRDNPKRNWSKAVGGTRPLKNFALPMILCNLSLEIEHLLPTEVVEKLIRECIHEVMEVFYDKESGLILENVTPDGQFSDSFEGRLLNPGHAIEAMWFIMDLGERLNDSSLIEKAKQLTLRTLEYAWDEKYGGIFYFMDIKNKPVQQLEWDQKLWWVHIETIIALLKGYLHTGDERCWEWFEKVHDWTWKHFPDPKYGEWFGYLSRNGEPLLTLKGGKWKGCYHIPRGLYQSWKTLEKIIALKESAILHTK
ncbi:MAG: AGE family epimerase/isomerase [Spirosomaceae bacterium]|nr:AGE family epimerase/isomerase [Spirosomataceae bacterium]